MESGSKIPNKDDTSSVIEVLAQSWVECSTGERRVQRVVVHYNKPNIGDEFWKGFYWVSSHVIIFLDSSQIFPGDVNPLHLSVL